MRDGRVVDSRPTASSDAASLARAMVGREVSLRGERSAFGLVSASPTRTRADVHRATTTPRSGGPALRDHGRHAAQPRWPACCSTSSPSTSPAARSSGSPASRATGSGSSATSCRACAPSTPVASRSTVAQVVTGRAGADGGGRRRRDPRGPPRLRRACSTSRSPRTSSSPSPERVARAGLMDHRVMRDAGDRADRSLPRSPAPAPDAPMWSLSGGNQQRVVLARELSHDPRVLVAAQPTRGLDVGAIEYMSDRLRDAAADGVAVLLISTELEEILDLVRPHRRDVRRPDRRRDAARRRRPRSARPADGRARRHR